MLEFDNINEDNGMDAFDCYENVYSEDFDLDSYDKKHKINAFFNTLLFPASRRVRSPRPRFNLQYLAMQIFESEMLQLQRAKSVRYSTHHAYWATLIFSLFTVYNNILKCYFKYWKICIKKTSANLLELSQFQIYNLVASGQTNWRAAT